MKTEVKEKWIEALTSGEYSQTTDMLKNNEGGFCCLGVLCDLFIKSQDEGRWSLGNLFTFNEPDVESDLYTTGWDTELPAVVMEWAGLEDAHGRYGIRPTPEVRGNSLARDNDSGDNFKVIAKTIKREF